MRYEKRTINRTMTSTWGKFHCGEMHELAYDDAGDAVANMRRSTHGGYDWTGTRTVDEVKQHVTHGSRELAGKMRDMIDQVDLPPALMRPEIVRRRRRTRGDFGNELDIHRVYQGRCDVAWDKVVHDNELRQGNKLVHLCIDLGASCGIEASSTLWRGAAAMRIYEALSRMGKSIAVSVYYAAQNMFNEGHGMISVRVKEYGQPMREEQLAATVSVGFLRGILFGASRSPEHGISDTYGLGFPISDYSLPTYAAQQDAERGGRVVVVGQAFSRAQAQKVVDDFVSQTLDQEVRGLSSWEQIRHGIGGVIP